MFVFKYCTHFYVYANASKDKRDKCSLSSWTDLTASHHQ